MSKGVFTRMKRFTLVEKTASEVGDGTSWPMLVTLDQLAEILYRAKDAWFTSGSISTTPGDSPSAGIGMSMEAGSPPNELISGDGTYFFIRGYCWWGQNHDLAATDSAFFGSSYGTDLLPSSYPFGTEYLSAFFPPAVEPYVSDGLKHRDISDDERCVFLPDNPDLDPMVNEPPRINGSALRTAFSQEMACSGAGTGYLIDHPSPSQLRLEIYPGVAWVDENESGNPYDPLNKLYLKMRFGVLCTSSPFDIVALDTRPDSGFHSYVEATDLTFQLSDSTCSAKIYFYEGYDFYEGYGGSGAASFSSASPFILTVKEWWPYAKGDPATPVWDSATGAKL